MLEAVLLAALLFPPEEPDSDVPKGPAPTLVTGKVVKDQFTGYRRSPGWSRCSVAKRWSSTARPELSTRTFTARE